MAELLEDHSTEFVANPTQKKFIESRHEADLFSSRKGEGKSAALAWAIFFHTRHNPGAYWLVIRDTFENLQRTTMEEFFFWFPDGVYGTYHAGKKYFEWNTERTGLKGRVYWLGVDDDGDATKIASMPLAGLAIDEPSAAAGSSAGVSEFIFDTAMSQLRQPGMKWYAVKLAQNNPDESHWTYRRFVDPGYKGTPTHNSDGEPIELPPLQQRGFVSYQTNMPENLKNLPAGYYEGMEERWKHRPDLVKRFVKGEYGYQQVGKAVTPQWSDNLHLARGLEPQKGMPLIMLWDGGLNPTCVITQVTSMGFWLFLESFSEGGIGMYQLIEDVVQPAVAARYKHFTWSHIGDPNLRTPEQSDSRNTAVKVIKTSLGGRFRPGPDSLDGGLEPLRHVLTRTINGTGVIQVDRQKCRHIWYALRGGWHYHVTRSGVVGEIVKDQHSHPGDCVRYGAGLLFPLGSLQKTKKAANIREAGNYFNRAPHPGSSIGMARPGARLPKEARTIGGPGNGRN